MVKMWLAFILECLIGLGCIFLGASLLWVFYHPEHLGPVSRVVIGMSIVYFWGGLGVQQAQSCRRFWNLIRNG